MRCAVIADDLTGASDTAVQFAKRGYLTPVLLEWQGGGLAMMPLVALDTESRHLSPEDAYARVYDASSALREAGFAVQYKKMDSTLRGNLGAELDGVLDATGLQMAVVAPAFPANGRTTIGGYQHHHGTRLEQTAFAHDLLCPVLDSCVSRLVARQSRRRVGSVSLELVQAGAQALIAEFEGQRRAGIGVAVVDAETDEDLVAIARALERWPVPVLPAGSAGLAEFFAHRLPLRPMAASATGRSSPGSILVVAGSTHPLTAAQIEALIAAGEAAAACVPAATETPIREWPAAKTLILRLERTVDRPQADISQGMVASLASQARKALECLPIQGLVLVGGDTATAVLAALGARGLAVEREVQPGIPAGHLVGGTFAGTPVVTKAGGFGDESALLAAAEYLRGEWDRSEAAGFRDNCF